MESVKNPNAPEFSPGASGKDEIYMEGYLEKRRSDGRWQERYFETNGTFLTYYKTKKMSKLLAAVRLSDTSEITVLDQKSSSIDPEGKGNVFSIVLNQKAYYIKAESRAIACKWVEVLTILRDKDLASSEIPMKNGEVAEAYDTKKDTPQICFFACCSGRDEAGR